MRRRNLLVVLAGLAVVVAAGVVVVWSRKDLITRDRYDRIQAGMTRTKVEAILGGPPGDYRTVPTEAEQWQGCYDIDADASEAGCYKTLADGEIRPRGSGTRGLFESGSGRECVPGGKARYHRVDCLAYREKDQRPTRALPALSSPSEVPSTTSSGVPNACGTAGSRSRPCDDGSCLWRWRDWPW